MIKAFLLASIRMLFVMVLFTTYSFRQSMLGKLPALFSAWSISPPAELHRKLDLSLDAILSLLSSKENQVNPSLHGLSFQALKTPSTHALTLSHIATWQSIVSDSQKVAIPKCNHTNLIIKMLQELCWNIQKFCHFASHIATLTTAISLAWELLQRLKRTFKDKPTRLFHWDYPGLGFFRDLL